MALNGMAEYIDRSKLSYRCYASNHLYCNGTRLINRKVSEPCECDCHKEKQ